MNAKKIQETALTLPEADRASLAAVLLDSLPRVLVDSDDGLAEAKRRDRELDESEDAGCTWKEIKAKLGR